jgi:SET domain-containing protein
MRASAESPSPSSSRRSRRTTQLAPTAAATSDAVEVRRSSIQGRGVFALRDIAEGERIIEYTGERISHDEATSRYDDEAVKRHHTFLFTVDDDICIDGSHGGNEARFINHSCEPNAYALVQKKRIFIRALRAIEAGEEVVYDYWYSTDPGYTDEDLRRLYPCRCGTESCRGTLAAPAKPKKKPASKPKRARSRNGSR